MSIADGSVLAMLGLGRRDLTGLIIAGVGGALAYRGATGHCAVYESLGIDSAHHEDGKAARRKPQDKSESEVSACYLINKSPESLYSFWRDFENLPQFMTHLESVQKLDERKSHWVAKAPAIYGGKVEWDAEIVEEEPNSRIAWRSLPGGDVEHHGSITFAPALGDRGTKVRVEMFYRPPAGQLGRWVAKLFGEEPEQQIRDDLRRFKRLMEVGEILTIEGQPRGTCLGHGKREGE
jgi:uncharacterized membrane protein